VLVIEDHDDVRESLRLLLVDAGHSVVTAEDGVDGLALLRSWRPDVAIVDIGLPGLDGYAVARAVRADPELSGVLLVALTGYGQLADEGRAIEAGFHRHLVKPVSLEVLGRVLGDTAPSQSA
jgi:CheY-like chemotaxis protein